jgi:hypothetical protein
MQLRSMIHAIEKQTQVLIGLSQENTFGLGTIYYGDELSVFVPSTSDNKQIKFHLTPYSAFHRIMAGLSEVLLLNVDQ